MDFSLRYREGQFSPADAAAITGVALHLQRDWRSQGLLKAREGGRATRIRFRSGPNADKLWRR